MAAKPKPETRVVKLDERGQLTVLLDADYTLRPSVEAIMEAERETGLSLFDLASLAANGRMMIAQMGVVIAAFMRAHGKANPDDPLRSSYIGAKGENLSGLIMEASTARVQGALAILLAGAVNGGYTASGEAKAATTT